MMLGFLLARAGIDVVVLEKHADFFRDFRGDTIHPSTLQVMDELGLLDDFLKLPHSEIRELGVRIGGVPAAIGDFTHVPGRCKFIALMPQWDFLNFIAERARTLPQFRLLMQTQALDLIREGSRVTGVVAAGPGAEQRIAADLVVACDGRHSTLRQAARLKVVEEGAPIDALWMRLSRKPDDPPQTFGNIAPGGILVAIDRTTYYQCAFVIRKGGFERIRQEGIEAFREQVAEIAPFLADRVGEIASFDDAKLLTVVVDRLERWYTEGLLCIGDAAHAMSPVGGVGINLAIADAVAAANILAGPLQKGRVSLEVLRAVQKRREFPMRVIQSIQVIVQNRLLNRILSTREQLRAPAAIRLLDAIPYLRRVPARLVGVGVRPEHVRCGVDRFDDVPVQRAFISPEDGG